MELYKKYRPKTLKGVVGQPEAVAVLTKYLECLGDDDLPHSILFSGGSGVGKTTLARILVKELGCHQADFSEINTAASRGIDMVREVQQRISMAPGWGPCRVWLLDEVHQLTKKAGGDAQTALLKTLEDTPRHVYFFLCTTHPELLLETIRQRCTPVKLRQIPAADLKGLISSVLFKEKKELSDDVIDRIVEVSDGSARQALVLLDSVIRLDTEEAQIAVIQKKEVKQDAFSIVKALLWERAKWADVAKVLREIDCEDPEGLRRLILKNARNELVKGGKNSERAFAIICAFESNFFDSGDAGLARACYEVAKK